MPNKLNSKITNETEPSTLASANIDVLRKISIDNRGRLTYDNIPVGSYSIDDNGNIDFTNFVLWSTVDIDNDGIVDESKVAHSIKDVNYSANEISDALGNTHKHDNLNAINNFKVIDGKLHYDNEPILVGYNDTDILKKKEYTDANGDISYSSKSGMIEGFDLAPNKTFYGKNRDGVVGFHLINAELNVAIEQYRVRCSKDFTRVIDLPFASNNNNIIVQCFEKVDEVNNDYRNIYEMLDTLSDSYYYNYSNFSFTEYGEIKKEHYYNSTLTENGIYETDEISIDDFLELSSFYGEATSFNNGLISIIPPLISNTSDPNVIISASSVINSSYEPWRAFSGVTNSSSYVWYCASLGMITPQWIKIEFLKPMRATGFTYSTHPSSSDVSPKEYLIEGSNDSLNWDTLYLETNAPAKAATNHTYGFINNKEYKYYRIRITKSYSNEVSLCGFNLCTEKGLSPLVPALTSNNSVPGIVVKASSILNDTYAEWRAFNGSNISASDCWHNNSSDPSSGAWLQVSFSKRVPVMGFTYSLRNSGTVYAPVKYSIEGSNNEVDWYTLYEGKSDILTQAYRYEQLFSKSYVYQHYRFKFLQSTSTTYASLGLFNLLGTNRLFFIKTNNGFFSPNGSYYDVVSDSFQPVYEISNNSMSFDDGIGDLNSIIKGFDINGIHIDPLKYFRKFKIVSNVELSTIRLIGLKSFEEKVCLKKNKNISSASKIYSLTPVVEISDGCDIRGLISINNSPWSKYNVATQEFDVIDENLILEQGMSIEDISNINFIGTDVKNINFLFIFKVNKVTDICKLNYITVKQKSRELFKKISEQDYDVEIYVDEIRFTPKIDKSEFIINVMM